MFEYEGASLVFVFECGYIESEKDKVSCFSSTSDNEVPSEVRGIIEFSRFALEHRQRSAVGSEGYY